MTYNQTLVRKAASIARRAGFRTIVTHSKVTRSDYLFIGFPSRHSPKGFNPVAELQVTNYHAREGWHRLGITDRKDAYELQPTTPNQDAKKVSEFINRFINHNYLVSIGKLS